MSAPRRRFLKSLAAAPLLPAVIAEPQASPAPQPAPPPAAAPPAADPAAGPLTEVVRLRYGAHFEGSDDLAVVKEEIARNLRSAARLKSLGLRNGDEPVTVFSARVPGRGKPWLGRGDR